MIKTFSAEMASVIRSRDGARNIKVLSRFFFVLAAMISVYSLLFHFLMLREGQEHTWMTGLYWTLTVMSTLGFGDITFHTDLGRVFSILVLLSGMVFLLILLPFIFIEFFYEPWMKAQAAARAPRRLPEKYREHVLLTSHDPVTIALIRRLEHYQYRYSLVVPELEEALRLHDLGIKVMVGELDDPQTWQRARIEEAALVASTASDVRNTSVAFTVRELVEQVPIITSATDEDSVDIMRLAGSSFVLRLEDMVGRSFARLAVGGDSLSHVIGRFDDLLIAEANVRHTPLVGKTLRESGDLFKELGVTVAGVSERGRFVSARAETEIHAHTLLVLAGTQEHLERYDEHFGVYNVPSAPVLILGGGRVGRATARALAQHDVDYRIVEQLPERVRNPEKYILGNAADRTVLERAGIGQTSTVIITPHDDEMNVYLTIYCRQLRPDIQISARASQDRGIASLHRAGADCVLSYASMGANAIMNFLRRSDILMIAEGLYLFKMRVPAKLAGSTIAQCSIRQRTGCSVVAIRTQSSFEAVPNPGAILPSDGDIVLIGTSEAEERFLAIYGQGTEG